MEAKTGPNQPITITLEQWRWEQILLCLDRYVGVLRNDDAAYEDIATDAEWANQLDAMTDEFRALVTAGGNDVAAGTNVSESATPFDVFLTPPIEPQPGKPWTADENAAVIGVYFWMLDQQRQSRDYSKVEAYRTLIDGPLHIRTRQSIEYKMRNISAVLAANEMEWVVGLKPLSNFQSDLGVAVEEHLGIHSATDRNASK